MNQDSIVFAAATDIIKVRWKNSGRVPNPVTRGGQNAKSVLEMLKSTGVFPEDYGRSASTGNLEHNGIKISCPEAGHIVVEVDEAIAPYMPYTTEPWVAPQWKGKKNPNQGWWDAFAAEFAQTLARKLRGKVTQSMIDGKIKRTKLQNVMRRKAVQEAMHGKTV